MNIEDCESIEELEDGMWTPCAECGGQYDLNDLVDAPGRDTLICSECKEKALEAWGKEYANVCKENNVEWLYTGNPEDYVDAFMECASPKGHFEDELECARADS